MAPPELLLLSSGRVFGSEEPLAYALEVIRDFLGPRKRMVLVPFAGKDHAAYLDMMTTALAPLGVQLTSVHQGARLDEADAVYVPGGNSFRLLKTVQHLGLLDQIRQRVQSGKLLYMGVSAGSNLACPTIRTTNDMPIVQPDSFAALGLIPFQINPHYQDPPLDSTHMGETREQRIAEFLDENDVPVIGLREGTWLRRSGDHLALGGSPNAMLFERDRAPRSIEPATDLSWLLTREMRFDSPAVVV